MRSFSISGALKTGWRSFMLRPWYLFGLALAVMALFAFSIGDAFVTALAYIIYGGYVAVVIRHYHGERVVFDDLFTIDNRWIYFAFLGLIKGLLILLGLIFFIVPGIYLAVRWMFAELLVIDQGMRPLAALRASSELTEGHRWHLFFYSVVVSLLLIIGVLLLVVGAVVASVVALIATIKIYEDLKNPVVEGSSHQTSV